MTQVRFAWGELRDIAAIMELLDSQSNEDGISQFAGGTLEWFTGDECEGWIEWDDDQFWFVPASNIAAGELDEYRELHNKNQQEIYRLRRQIEELQGRHDALDEATEQAQDLDMGY
jgi:DnaJ-domain-containing protein 1